MPRYVVIGHRRTYKAGASTEGGVDAACVQFGSGGKEFCRQGGNVMRG
jgi:hypothetical protein